MMLSNKRPPVVETRPLLSIKNVSKEYGIGEAALKALDGISLDIQANEFCTLLGPSGCGKTTLLRIVAGFASPTSGDITLDGEDLTLLPPNRRPVNTVFQSYALFPHMNVEQNVAFGLERLKFKEPDLSRRVSQVLDLVRLGTMAKRFPRELSGGQQQRVALARALAPKPRLLLLDEPLSALDLKLRRGMQTELKRLQRETGITFVLVTHDQEEALFMSDRIAVIGAGKLLQTGTPHDIYEHPKNRFVADFIGEANVLPGNVFGVSSDFVAVRPERVAITTSPRPDADFSGLVSEVNYLGSSSVCVVSLDKGDSVKVILPAPHEVLSVGQKVFCSVSRAAVLPLEN